MKNCINHLKINFSLPFQQKRRQILHKLALLEYAREVEEGFVGTFEEYEELFFAHIAGNEQPNRAARREMKRSK